MRIITRQDMEQIMLQRTHEAQPYKMPQGMYVDVSEFPDGCIFPDGCRFEYVQTSLKKWIRFGDYCKFGEGSIFAVPAKLGCGVQLGKRCTSSADMVIGKYAIIGEGFRVECFEERAKPIFIELGAYSRLGDQFVIKGDVELGAYCIVGKEGTFYYSAEVGKYIKIGDLCRFKGRAVFAAPTYFDGICKFGNIGEIEAIAAISIDIPVPEDKRNIMTVYCQPDHTLTEVCMSGGRLYKSSIKKAVQIAKIIFEL